MALEKQVTSLRKLDSTQPFKEGIPFINIFNVTRELDWETIPQEYWVDAQEAFYAEQGICPASMNGDPEEAGTTVTAKSGIKKFIMDRD